MKWTRLLRTMILTLSTVCLMTGLTMCAPRVVAIPDDRQIIDLSKGCDAKPGWYAISGGFLKQIYQDLDKCKNK